MCFLIKTPPNASMVMAASSELENNSCDWFWSLSLAWAIAQLGWIAGPAVMFLFSFVIYYTSSLLADCYRSGDPVSGKRNYTYMDAV
ncbi:Amino acid permease 4 [Vitis vinifera]|uniref:Amino acid permease 4 n=1 Tax=Vitis vinifera TaxID=29760 RepID=A0A438FG92_VITVI|nr:Amino acid permease 4 [Vitis vinifera]